MLSGGISGKEAGGLQFVGPIFLDEVGNAYKRTSGVFRAFKVHEAEQRDAKEVEFENSFPSLDFIEMVDFNLLGVELRNSRGRQATADFHSVFVDQNGKLSHAVQITAMETDTRGRSATITMVAQATTHTCSALE